MPQQVSVGASTGSAGCFGGTLEGVFGSQPEPEVGRSAPLATHALNASTVDLSRYAHVVASPKFLCRWRAQRTARSSTTRTRPRRGSLLSTCWRRPEVRPSQAQRCRGGCTRATYATGGTLRRRRAAARHRRGTSTRIGGGPRHVTRPSDYRSNPKIVGPTNARWARLAPSVGSSGPPRRLGPWLPSVARSALAAAFARRLGRVGAATDVTRRLSLPGDERRPRRARLG
jgi:hypothetical protein